MNNPLISVIAPVYKVENFLERCLDAMRAQRFTDYELILVNDGSPDRSGEICDRYAKLDERFIVIHQQNSGVGVARNAAFDAARADLIAYIDTDDNLSPDYLSNLYDAQQLNDADMVISRFHRLSDIDPDRDVVTAPRGELFITHDQIADALIDLCDDTRIYTLWAKLFKRELLIGLRYKTDVMIGGDTVLMGEMLERAQSMQLTDAADYYYCERQSGSITSQINPKLYQGYLYVHQQFCQSIEKAGFMSDALKLILNQRLGRYATRAIHSIRRGNWTVGEQCKYVDDVLGCQPFLDAIAAVNAQQPNPEYALILKKDAAALLNFYEKRSQKNALAKQFPWLIKLLGGIKHLIKGGTA